MVQKKILTKTGFDTDGNPVGTVGVLALGKLGDIVARAFGPIEQVYVNKELKDALAADGATGTLAFGKGISVTLNGRPLKGIIVNPNDNVFVGSADAPLEQANVPCEGSQIGVMQFGTTIVSCADVETIKTVVNGDAGVGYDPALATAGIYGATIDEWTSKTYSQGDKVQYKGFVYKAKAAISTAETEFTPDNWTVICSADEIDSICEFTAYGPVAD